MDIKHLRYFVAVAEALSFTKAASNLNIAPQPLSMRVAELERELGVRLFDRNSKKVALTTAGKAFLPRAREAVQGFDAAMLEGRLLGPNQSRHIRIAFPYDTSQRLMSDVVSRLQQRQIAVDLVEAAGTPERRRRLLAGEIDISVLFYPFEEQGLWVSDSLAQPMGVILAAEHPLAKIEKLRLDNLIPYPLVQRHLHPDSYDELLDHCRAEGYVPPYILHASEMKAVALKTKFAVMLALERDLKSFYNVEPHEFIWKPLEGSPVHGWTSVVCRSNEYAGITRVAVDMIFASLQQRDAWVLRPRPSTKCRNNSEFNPAEQCATPMKHILNGASETL